MRHRLIVRLAMVSVVVLGVTASIPVHASPVHASPVHASSGDGVDVSADDAGDRFTGTGGILLPADAARSDRQTAWDCPDCRWRMTDPCMHATDPGAQAACRTLASTCADDGALVRTFISRDAGVTWEYLGLHCIPPTGPVTAAAVGARVQETFERRVPAGSITTQPSSGVLPHLPVLFDSGQPSRLPSSEHIVAGFRVVLTPRATWHWDFGDGGRLTTSVAGSRYPDTTVSHVYRRDGAHLVRLRTVWRADYAVDGVGPIPVPDPVIQEASIPVRVGQGRAVLVP